MKIKSLKINNLKELVSYLFTGNIQVYREAIDETKKFLPKIQFNSDNYDIDSRIKYLSDNNIKVKYKGI